MKRLTLATLAVLLATLTAIAAPDDTPAVAPPVVVRHAELSRPRTFDPHLAGDVVSSRQTMHAYECLLEYDPFLPGTLRPCLAADMPTFDRESLTYTFKLRDDVRFADAACFEGGKGRAVTAHDVVYSIKRLAALAYTGGYWIVEGAIVGLDAFRDAALDALEDSERAWLKCLERDVPGLRAVDDRTVAIRLHRPYPQLLHALSLSYGAVVPRESAKLADIGSAPVGTGPFVLKQSDESTIRWARNPNYRDVKLTGVTAGSPLKAYEGRRLPLADEVRYDIVEDTDTAMKGFLAGDYVAAGLDLDQFPRFIDTDAMKKGVTGDDLLKPEWRKRELRVVDHTEPTLHYLAFNMADEVVGTPAGERGRAIRKAMALAFDRQDYVDKLLNHRGVVADRLIPAGVFGHEQSGPMAGQRHDPAAGRKMLTDAGFVLEQSDGAWVASHPDGGQIKVTVLHRSTREATLKYAGWLTERMAEVGIALENELMSFADFLRRTDEGSGQAYDYGWLMDYPDAQNMLQLLYGPNKAPGVNSGNFDHPEYNKAYAELARLDDTVEADRRRKGELITSMRDVLDAETPWITIEFRRNVSLRHDAYHAPAPNSFDYGRAKYEMWAKR